MIKSNRKEKKLLIVRSWLEKTTAHGVPYVIGGSTLFQKMIWLIILVGATIAFGYYFIENVMKYMAEPTSVSMDLQAARFIAPDVHICNTKPLSYERMLQNHDVASQTGASLKSDLKNDLEKLGKLIKKKKTSQTDFEYFWATIQRDKLYKAVGHLASQTVFFAWYESGNLIPISQFQLSLNTEYFSCFRLSLEKQSDFKTASKPLVLILYTDDYNFENSDLRLMDMPLEDYYYNTSPTIVGLSGMMMIFTPPGGYPHVESDSVLVSPGRSTAIKLKMQETYLASTSRRPCHAQDEYIDYSNPLLGGNHTIRYLKTVYDCKYRKIIEKIMLKHSNCQCLPYMLPVSQEMALTYPICANLSRAMNDSHLAEIRRESRCIDLYYRYDMEFDISDCSSENPCKSIIYTSKASSTEWLVTRNIDEIIDKVFINHLKLQKAKGMDIGFKELLFHSKMNSSHINDYVKYNFARVSLSIGEKQSLRIRESVTYGLENLLSDTGGLAGLYLGMSILTFFELINLVHDICVRRWKRKDVQLEPEDL